MELKEFQLQAVKSLFEAMGKPSRDIVLKSPTGSGYADFGVICKIDTIFKLYEFAYMGE